jgi:ubiquinone/menaquinone biosynthesis C-methylase UbiE
MDEIKYLTEYYSNYDEDGRLTSKHGQVEFLTTMRYINKFLKKGMRVLEVGAGTGRYSLTIAEKGFQGDFAGHEWAAGYDSVAGPAASRVLAQRGSAGA